MSQEFTRITIEDSDGRRIMVELPDQNPSIWTLRNDLLRPMLLAMQFHPDTIEQIMPAND